MSAIADIVSQPYLLTRGFTGRDFITPPQPEAPVVPASSTPSAQTPSPPSQTDPWGRAWGADAQGSSNARGGNRLFYRQNGRLMMRVDRAYIRASGAAHIGSTPIRLPGAPLSNWGNSP